MTGRAPRRLVSLDVFRGLVVVLLVLVEWLFPSPGYSWLRHSPWNGIRIADLVFPAFLFMVGASAAVGRSRRWQQHVRRAVTLIAVGLLFNAWGDSNADLSQLRLSGVLQMIGVAGLLAAIVIAVARRPTVVAVVAAGLLLVHGVLLSQVPLACGTGRLVPGCSLPWAVDRRFFGVAHLYRHGQLGHDPEGLVATLFGATAIVLIGWVAARLLGDRAELGLLIVATFAGTGLAALVWPPMKRLWTPTFSLLMMTACTAVLLLFSVTLDRAPRKRPQPVRWTLTALARNALLIYVAQHVVHVALDQTPRGSSNLSAVLLDHVGSPLWVAVAAVAAATAIASALHALDWHWTL